MNLVPQLLWCLGFTLVKKKKFKKKPFYYPKFISPELFIISKVFFIYIWVTLFCLFFSRDLDNNCVAWYNEFCWFQTCSFKLISQATSFHICASKLFIHKMAFITSYVAFFFWWASLSRTPMEICKNVSTPLLVLLFSNDNSSPLTSSL